MGKCGRSGDPGKAQRWRELVERWQASGQTVREFCRGAEVRESAFYWWKRRLARRHGSRGLDRDAQASLPSRRTDVKTSAASGDVPRAGRFLPVQVVMDQATGSGVEIHWDNGRTVRLRRGFDRRTLAEVLIVLEGPPC